MSEEIDVNEEDTALTVPEELTLEERLKAQFMVPGTSLEQIARVFTVPIGKLRELAEAEGWQRERTMWIAAATQRSEEQLAMFRSQEVFPAVQEVMKSTKLGMEKLYDAIDEVDATNPKAANTLEHLAKASAGFAGITARMLAVSGPTQKVEMEVSGSVGFLSGGGPMAPKAIDVKAEDITDL